MTENENNLLEYYERLVQSCVKQCDGVCNLRDKECECVDANVLDHLREFQEYKAIGTIEECRTAVERMKPKKVVHIHKSDAPEDIEYMGEEVLYGKCPCCDGYNNNLWNAISCGDCGALLDWSE